eukprot:TRINITY_DN12914_c0_g1_i1.p1 TRINITY_DN12914_c0_g1~~TRINITY_DN12914_c0_g1_i1.p1  ORF type:complete len:277 (-),score=-4.95 TRINITY_DN12914_c0_g1_i1:130-960(-)
MPKGKITLELDEKSLKLSSAKTTASLKVFNADEYPNIKKIEGTSIEYESYKLLDKLEKVSVAVGVSIGFDMNAALLISDGTEIEFVATDGVRFAQTSVLDPKYNAIIHSRALGHLKKFLSEEEEKVVITVSETRIQFDTEGASFFTTLVSAKYPDYAKFIPERNKEDISINRESLIEALKRVDVIGQSKEEYPIIFKLDKNSLILENSNPSIGSIIEELDVSYEGEPITFGFFVKNILNVLEIMVDKDIILNIMDKDKPLVINKDDYTYLSLPVRI